MTYTIVYLEDDDTIMNATELDICERDPKNATIKHASRISEAKQLLREPTDIAFIIVDLWLTKEPTAPGEIPQGGYDFVKWVLTQEELSELPILVVTAHGDQMIPRLKKKLEEIISEKDGWMRMQIQTRVCIVIRSNDFDDWDKAIYQYMNNARHRDP